MNEPRANMHGGTLQYMVAVHTYVIRHNKDVSVYAWGRVGSFSQPTECCVRF